MLTPSLPAALCMSTGGNTLLQLSPCELLSHWKLHVKGTFAV